MKILKLYSLNFRAMYRITFFMSHESFMLIHFKLMVKLWLFKLSEISIDQYLVFLQHGNKIPGV